MAASVSYSVTETKLFRPLRQRIRARSAFLGELFSCGYCLGHWVAFSLVAIYQPRLFESWWLLLDYFLTALAVSWLSAVQWVLMCLLMSTTNK